MIPIHFNKGMVAICGVALGMALVLANLYEGSNGTLIIIHVMVFTCILLEFSERWKARINGEFPIYWILIPVSLYVTYTNGGLWNALILLIVMTLLVHYSVRRGRRK